MKSLKEAIEMIEKDLPDGIDANITISTSPKVTSYRKTKKISEDVQTAKGCITPLSKVKVKPISWLWPGRIPLGKIIILGGEPDVGKTCLTMDLAARVTTGAVWPDESSGGEPGNVMILSAEDELADTIKPRLQSASANLDRVFSYEFGSGQNLTAGIRNLEKNIKKYKPKLLIIDPLNAYLAGIDTYRDSSIRAQVFSPLQKIAESNSVTIACVMHLNKNSSKNPKNRIMGSVGYIAASRTACLIASDKVDNQKKYMIPFKNNLGKNPKSLAFRIIGDSSGNPVLKWDPDPIDISPAEVLTPGKKIQPKDEAVDFLKELLSEGPLPANEVINKAKARGIAKRTLDRAKKKLKIKSKRSRNKFYWQLPTSSG